MFNEKKKFISFTHNARFSETKMKNFYQRYDSTNWKIKLNKYEHFCFCFELRENAKKEKTTRKIVLSKNSLLLLNVSAWRNFSCTYSCQCCSTFSRAVEVFLLFSSLIFSLPENFDMHFLSQTFFSHFRIHVSFSELQHFHTLFNFGLRFVKNQMKLKLHCFPSDIFIIIIKERKAMRLE